MTSVLVFGTGLIGTSVGLALRQGGGPDGYDVLLSDRDRTHVERAVQRGAGRPWDGQEAVDVVVVAAPVASTGHLLHEAQRLRLASTYTHVSSVQSQVQREVERLGCDLSLLVGGHPLAGRETSGPEHARADLFVGRPWAVCPTEESSPASVAAVHSLAKAVGAVPVEVSAEDHDRAVAVLSHLPHVVANALAGQLVTESGGQRVLTTELSGPGLVDTTRLAASDAGLWTQILSANRAFVAPAVRAVAEELEKLAAALESLGVDPNVAPGEDAAAVTAFLDRGRRGRALVPVKRGVRDVGFARVAVTVDDRPGRLAALLRDAAAAQVNVEDVHVDHVPGRPTGRIELLVAREAGPALVVALRDRGWAVGTDDVSE